MISGLLYFLHKLSTWGGSGLFCIYYIYDTKVFILTANSEDLDEMCTMQCVVLQRKRNGQTKARYLFITPHIALRIIFYYFIFHVFIKTSLLIVVVQLAANSIARQFKRLYTTYAFIKELGKQYRISIIKFALREVLCWYFFKMCPY